MRQRKTRQHSSKAWRRKQKKGASCKILKTKVLHCRLAPSPYLYPCPTTPPALLRRTCATGCSHGASNGAPARSKDRIKGSGEAPRCLRGMWASRALGQVFSSFFVEEMAFLVLFWGHRALCEVQGVGMPPAPLIHCPDEISEQFS